MKKTFSGFLCILLFGFGSVSAARAQVFAETGPPVVYVGQTWNTYVNFAAGDPSFCNSVAAANYVPQSCPGYWAYVVLSGDLGQGNVTTSSPCMGTFQPGGLPILEGGLVYKTAGTRTFTANVYSCTPSQPITGNIDGPPGILLGSWTTNLVVLTPPAVPPAPNNPPNPCSAAQPALIDPVAAGLVSAGAIVSSPSLGTASSSVQGAAADGATQLLLQIPATNVGDNLTVQVLNENNQPDSTANIGGLFNIGAPSSGATNTLQVQAASTSGGVMAFAAYISPTNFARQGNQSDTSSLQRTISFQVTCSGGNSQATKPSFLIRPPIALVHGLWTDSSHTWSNFIPANPQNQTLWYSSGAPTQVIDYSYPVDLTATTPSYGGLLGPQVSANALGFAFNAPFVLSELQKIIASYASTWKVAVVQADVIGHSMGGDISRTMANFAGFECSDASCGPANNYGFGPVHKLITIGTPHKGSPLAFDLLPSATADPNQCVRNALFLAGEVSLIAATVNGTSVDGAVQDLQVGVLNTQPFPIAYVAGTTSYANLNSLDSFASTSSVIYNTCGTKFNDPLALRLMPSLWNQEFSGVANDGVVAVQSQLNGFSSTLIFPGVIHSPGFEMLDFNPPTEVDQSSGIPDEVINLLNEQTGGTDFFRGATGGGGGSSS